MRDWIQNELGNYEFLNFRYNSIVSVTDIYFLHKWLKEISSPTLVAVENPSTIVISVFLQHPLISYFYSALMYVALLSSI